MFGLKKLFKRSSAGKKKRSFTAATNNRFTNGWVFQNLSSNAELMRSLDGLRGHSRDLAENNEYVSRFLNMCKTEVIGATGFKFQSLVKNPDGKFDRSAIKRIEEEFEQWSKRGNCTMDGGGAFNDYQNLTIETVARDGEILVRMVKGKAAGNKWGFALQFIEADHLDTNYNIKLQNGNKIILGIEFNKYMRPVAYWLLDDHPGDQYRGTTASRTRIPADQIIHVFILSRAGQARGIPWTSRAMRRTKMLDGYEEAELVAARGAAAKMGFYKTVDGLAPGQDPDDPESLKNADVIEDVEAGYIGVLPPDTDFISYDPQHPTSQVPMFIKSNLRAIASALNVSYVTLANDLEGVSYSSIRQGELKDRDVWKSLQAWMKNNFLNIVFENWLDQAILNQALNLPAAKMDKWLAFEFQGRGWQWIDPLKEVNANVIAVNNKFKTHSDIAAESGRDFDELLSRSKNDQELAKEHGLTLEANNNGEKSNVEKDEDD